MKKLRFWNLILVVLLSLTLNGVVLAAAPAQVPPPGVHGEAVENAGVETVAPAATIAGIESVALGYSFSQSSGSYTPITGGTVHGTVSNDDENFPAIDLGFAFTYNAQTFTQVSIQSNGFVAMGPTVVSSYLPLSSGSSNNVVAALGRDLEGNGTTSELMTLLEGVTPNRIFTIQWSHYKRYGVGFVGDDLNFQVKLYETSNKVEVVYGAFTVVTNAAPPTIQAGLRGDTNADFSNRTTTTDWTVTTAGATNTAAIALTELIYPPSGLIFSWNPQAYISLEPNSAISTCRGDTAAHSLTAFNGTASTETLEMSHSGNIWPITVEPESLILAPDASGDVTASVYIPWTAAIGNQDVTTVTATGQTSGLSDAATLTTTASMINGYAEDATSPAGRGVRDHSVVYWDGKLYKIGGYNGSPQAYLDIYDIATDSWSQGPDMPGTRQWIDCVPIDYSGTAPKIYCAGGYSGGSAQSSLYIYDILTNSWSTGAALPAARFNYVGVTYNNLYYVIGGYTTTYEASMLVYNPITNAWDGTLAPMSTARRYSSGGLIGDKIYVAGGYDGTALLSAEAYDIATNVWSPIAPMPLAWVSAADIVFNDRYLIMVGGYSSLSTASPSAQIYDSVSNTWDELPVFPHSLYGSKGDSNGSNFWVVSGRMYESPAWSYGTYTTHSAWCATCTPASGLDFTWDPAEPVAGSVVTFNASVTAGTPAITYDWNFGDGGTASGEEVTHTFASDSTYTVTVVATNCDGTSTTSISQDVTVIRPATITVNPLELHAIQPADRSTTQTLEICNTGDVALTWELNEAQATPPLSRISAPNHQPVSQPDIIRQTDGSVDCAAYQNYTGFEPRAVAAACSANLSGKQASATLAPTDIGFALDIGYVSDNFVSFPLNNFTGQTVIGQNAMPFYGMDFDPETGMLYALNDNTDQLGTIDLTTGAFTALVACPPGGGASNWTGFSIDPITGDFYASTATDLYTIDPVTGASTLVGAFGTTTMIAIAINSEGIIYGHDITSDSIYTINRTTGDATLVGLTGYAANFAQGMDFDDDDGTLYIFLYLGAGANVYGTVNLTTGAVTPLTTSTPQGEFEGAIPFIETIDLPWVGEDPLTGTLIANTCELVEVTFDSTGLAAGEYFGELEVSSNDPNTPLVTVPVTLTVMRQVYLPLIKK